MEERIDEERRRVVLEEALADPEFGSAPESLHVVSELVTGYVMSNGTFIPRDEPLDIPPEPGWLARAFAKFIGCR